MGRKFRKKRKKTNQRAYKYNSKIQRMLIPPVFNPYKKRKPIRSHQKHIKKNVKKKAELFKKSQLSVIKKLTPIKTQEAISYPYRKIKARLKGTYYQFDPRKLSVCHRRKIRREELFKKGLVGKGIAVSKIRITTPLSKIYCKRR